MKTIFSVLVLHFGAVIFSYSQIPTESHKLQKTITELINQYSQAREKSDTVLLKAILTSNVDQLVSTGEWRVGIEAAVEGMIKSSGNNPGTRTLRVEKIQSITTSSAIVDCRYEITNADGAVRKMWSTFIVVLEKDKWKIMSIRNMLPTESR